MVKKIYITGFIGLAMVALAFYISSMLLAMAGGIVMTPALLVFGYKRMSKKVSAKVDQKMAKLTGEDANASVKEALDVQEAQQARG